MSSIALSSAARLAAAIALGATLACHHHAAAPPAPSADAAAPQAPASSGAQHDDDSVALPPAPAHVERVVVESSGNVALGSRIVADAKYLYWFSAGAGIHRLAQSGGAPEVIVPSSSPHETVTAIAGSRAGVAWCTNDSFSPGNGAVHFLRGGAAPEAAITLATQQGFPLAIALDGSHVYWSTMAGRASAATIQRARMATGSPVETVTADSAGVTHLALDRTHVYFFSHKATSVVDVARVPKVGGDVAVLAPGQPSPTGLAVDATHVYYTVSGPLEMPVSPKCARPPCPVATSAPIYRAGELRRVPISGGTVETLASKLVAPRDVGLSAAAVYLRSGGGLKTVAKSGGEPEVADDAGQSEYIASEGKVFVIKQRGSR